MAFQVQKPFNKLHLDLGHTSVDMRPQTDTNLDGPAVKVWLYFLCLMIFAMILVGGATRLTDSGLSITEWQPILGIVPPMSESAWNEAFALYKQIPEYKIINQGMSLDEFKSIYWWEWAHRFLGRMIGFAFLLPFLYFAFRQCLSRNLIPTLVIMFMLGGLQGLLGWYMVQSGLVERTDVSQYRLAAHLCAAVLIFGYIFWVALRLGKTQEPHERHAAGGRFTASLLVVAILVQIALGAFVAGLDAGQGYNTWPDMNGALVPDGLWVMEPWHLNLFENALTVQFNHRIFAYATVLLALLHATLFVKAPDNRKIKITGGILLLAIWAQAALGIVTLLAKVPISLGLAHQGMAIIVLAISLIHLSQFTPLPVRDRR